MNKDLKLRLIRGAYLRRDAGKRALTVAELNQDGKGRDHATRTMELVRADEETRTVELSFSSEFEGRRWFGIEILDHSDGAIRLDRLRGSGAVLMDHDWRDQVAVVESVTIDAKERKGRAVVRFSRSVRGQEIFQDVKDGIRKLVSVGYRVHDAKLVETRDGVDVYRVTDWEPYEISFVSVPFDTTVGVGRDAGQEIPQEAGGAAPGQTGTASTHQRGASQVNTKIVRRADGTLVRIEVDAAGNEVRQIEVLETAEQHRAAMQSGTDTERTRVNALTELGNQYRAAVPNAPDLARVAIRDGHSTAQLQAAILDEVNKRMGRPLDEQNRGAEIGMTPGEVRQFSFLRAIRHLADPGNSQLRKEAAFEIECSRAASEAYGKTPQGIMVPADVLGRAFSTTTPAGGAGGNLVATELQSGSFIELLRKRAWVLRKARRLAGLVGNVDIPRQKSGTAAYWVGEGGAPTGSEIGTDKISFNPKTLAAYSDITRRMLIQATPDAEMLTRADLLKSMGLEIDRAAIYGSGTANQPRGVRNMSGINAVAFAGVRPTHAELVAMETEIAADDADVDSMCYCGNAKFRGHAKTTLKFEAAGSATIWEPGNTVNGYEACISNQVEDGDVFFANWDDLIVAMWGGLDLTVDPYALSTTGGVRIITFQDVDFGIRHPESFCWGAKPAA
jgi:HK97 family phage major capsid protein/HK97 family phage prohead protease